MSQSYSIYGYSSFNKSFSDSYSFRHEIIANSFNHAIERFEKKFYLNFVCNWMFVVRSNDSTKTFYFDGVLNRFSDFNPVVQLVFNDIIL